MRGTASQHLSLAHARAANPSTYGIRQQVKEDEEQRREAQKEDVELVHLVHGGVHHFRPSVIHRDAKHGHVRLRVTVSRSSTTSTDELTRGNVSNCLRSLMKQNSCILIDEVISSKHMVNRIKLPSFFPGPKIYREKRAISSCRLSSVQTIDFAASCSSEGREKPLPNATSLLAHFAAAYFVEKVLEERTGLQQSRDAEHLEVGERTAVERRDAMNRRADGEHEFEFEDRSTDVILEAEREDLEERFQIEEDCEQRLGDEQMCSLGACATERTIAYLDFLIDLSIPLVDGSVVRVLDRRCEDRVRQHDDHHDGGERRRLYHLEAYRRRDALLLILIDVDQLQRAVIGFLQDLDAHDGR